MRRPRSQPGVVKRLMKARSLVSALFLFVLLNGRVIAEPAIAPVDVLPVLGAGWMAKDLFTLGASDGAVFVCPLAECGFGGQVIVWNTASDPSKKAIVIKDYRSEVADVVAGFEDAVRLKRCAFPAHEVVSADEDRLVLTASGSCYAGVAATVVMILDRRVAKDVAAMVISTDENVALSIREQLRLWLTARLDGLSTGP